MYYYTEYITICTSRSQVEHANLITEPLIIYIDIQGTTPNFFPGNLGILLSGMGQLQEVLGNQIIPLNKKSKTCNWKRVDI